MTYSSFRDTAAQTPEDSSNVGATRGDQTVDTDYYYNPTSLPPLQSKSEQEFGDKARSKVSDLIKSIADVKSIISTTPSLKFIDDDLFPRAKDAELIVEDEYDELTSSTETPSVDTEVGKSGPSSTSQTESALTTQRLPYKETVKQDKSYRFSSFLNDQVKGHPSATKSASEDFYNPTSLPALQSKSEQEFGDNTRSKVSNLIKSIADVKSIVSTTPALKFIDDELFPRAKDAELIQEDEYDELTPSTENPSADTEVGKSGPSSIPQPESTSKLTTPRQPFKETVKQDKSYQDQLSRFSSFFNDQVKGRQNSAKSISIDSSRLANTPSNGRDSLDDAFKSINVDDNLKEWNKQSQIVKQKYLSEGGNRQEIGEQWRSLIEDAGKKLEADSRKFLGNPSQSAKDALGGLQPLGNIFERNLEPSTNVKKQDMYAKQHQEWKELSAAVSQRLEPGNSASDNDASKMSKLKASKPKISPVNGTATSDNALENASSTFEKVEAPASPVKVKCIKVPDDSSSDYNYKAPPLTKEADFASMDDLLKSAFPATENSLDGAEQKSPATENPPEGAEDVEIFPDIPKTAFVEKETSDSPTLALADDDVSAQTSREPSEDESEPKQESPTEDLTSLDNSFATTTELVIGKVIPVGGVKVTENMHLPGNDKGEIAVMRVGVHGEQRKLVAVSVESPKSSTIPSQDDVIKVSRISPKPSVISLALLDLDLYFSDLRGHI